MLHIFNDHSPVQLTPEEREKATKCIGDMLSALCYGKMLLKDEERIITRQDVSTVLGLNASYHQQLAELFHYEDVLVEQERLRYQEIREANLRIRALEEELGGKQSAQSLSAGLRTVQNTFRAWYKGEGLFYVTNVTCGQYGMSGEITEDIAENKCDWEVTKKNYGNKQAILDTDKNREKMAQIVTGAFPNAQVKGYTAIINVYDNDDHDYFLRTQIFIPYEDIRILGEEK